MNKVWTIINRDIYTEEGQEEIEKISLIVDKIGELLALEELEILEMAIDTNLYPLMDLVIAKCIEKGSKKFKKYE